MTAPVQTPILAVGKVEYVSSPARLPDWFVDYLKARRRALMQELRDVEKALVSVGELSPEVLRRQIDR